LNTSAEVEKVIKCPKPHCRYRTKNGEQLIDHLIARHEKQAYQYLRVLLIRGDVRITVADADIERVDVDVKESAVEIREAGQVWTVEIQRDSDGSIWGVYPGKPVNDDIIFADGIRNLLILFQKGILRFEDLKRRKKEVEAQ